MNKSAGRLTSTNSPGHTVVLVDGARSMWARRIACRLRAVGLSVVPYVNVVLSARLMIRLAGRIASTLISMNCVPASSSTSRLCTTKPVNANSVFLRVRHIDVSPIMVRGDEPSAWFVDWDDVFRSHPSRSAVDCRILLPVAPLSIVRQAETEPWH